MNTEAKVGVFVLAGLVLLGLAVFLLGDFTFERRYTLYVTFTDVAGLTEKMPVKLSGVEVGKVEAISLEGSQAKVAAGIRQGVPVYKGAVFSVGSTGIIGSKFLQIDQGAPGSGTWPPGSVVEGVDPISIERALTKALTSMQDLVDGLSGKEGKQTPLTRNVNQTVAHLRDTTASMRELTADLSEMVADTKPQMTRTMDRMDAISAKLDSILASIDQGKGAVGALLNDEKMKTDIQETVADARTAVGDVKEVLSNLTKFKIYWNYDYRYEHSISQARGDLGIRIQPRPDRYYYLGGANLGNESDAPHARDYQKKNRIDALLGFQWGGVDLGVGVLRSGGGGRLTVTPFKGDPLLGRLSVFGQAYDFGRDRVVQGRRQDAPQYDVGAMVRLHRLIGVGVRAEDLAEVTRVQSWVNVTFEDKDIAHLFGLASFGAAGSRGRSK